MTESTPLDPLLRPRSVAVVGASRDPDSMSGVLLRNLRQSFAGPIYPVNPRAKEVGGLPAVASLADIAAPVDLAFVAVPAAAALQVAQQCVQHGVKAIVMITAGFSETGEQGRRRGDQLLQLVRSAGVPLVGPNCMGVINTDPARPLNGSFAITSLLPGNVAICTQSGALGFVLPDYIRQWGIGVSSFASIGNKLDRGENDLLRYWEHDPNTGVIQLYLESFQDPAEFRNIATRVSRRKPIVALKSGTTASGRRAAGSHTAALAGRDACADALLRQAAVIRANTLQELFEVTAVLACQGVPPGRRVAVLTDAGGPGILCVDALETHGLSVPALSQHLQDQLRAFLRPEAAVSNPIDLIGTADPQQFRRCLQHLLESGEFDAVIVIYVARLPGTSAAVAQAVAETAASLAGDQVVLGVFMQSEGPPPELMTAGCRVPSFLYPESAARALAAAVDYGEHRNQPAGQPVSCADMQLAEAREVVVDAARRGATHDGWLEAADVARLLTALRLPTPASEYAESAADAMAALQRIPSPVALKVVAPDVLHKSEFGGVALDLHDELSVGAACRRMLESVASAQGVLVQQMIGDGHEVMIGVTRDPQFGPLIACGAGGTLVELLDDVAFGLAPLTDVDIRRLLLDSRAGRLLVEGYRERPPGDAAAAREILGRVSCMAESIPEILEADFNPVRVLPPGRGAWIVDARIRVQCES